MKIIEKIDKHLNENISLKEIQKLNGKKVKIVTKKKKSVYGGILTHKKSDKEKILLKDLSIHSKDGRQKVKSKQGEDRFFKIDNIGSIEEIK